jgi:hypothetical protein
MDTLTIFRAHQIAERDKEWYVSCRKRGTIGIMVDADIPARKYQQADRQSKKFAARIEKMLTVRNRDRDKLTTHTPETALEFVERLAREVKQRGIIGELDAIEVAKYIERGLRDDEDWRVSRAPRATKVNAMTKSDIDDLRGVFANSLTPAERIEVLSLNRDAFVEHIENHHLASYEICRNPMCRVGFEAEVLCDLYGSMNQ